MSHSVAAKLDNYMLRRTNLLFEDDTVGGWRRLTEPGPPA